MKKLIPAILALALAAYWLLPDSETETEPRATFAANPFEAAQIPSTPEAIDVPQAQDVSPVRSRNPDCTIERHYIPRADGTVAEAISCEPATRAENPYDIYTDQDLLVLAYADAGAAEELGKRLLFQRQLDGATAYLMRAVALRPDDVKPLLYLQSQTGSLRGDAPGARDAVAHAYILSKTASYFDESVSTAWVEPDLVHYDFSAEDIARLDRIVDSNLEHIKMIQVEVFGESAIGEEL